MNASSTKFGKSFFIFCLVHVFVVQAENNKIIPNQNIEQSWKEPSNNQQVYLPEDIRMLLITLHDVNNQQTSTQWTLLREGLDVVEYSWVCDELSKALTTLAENQQLVNEEDYQQVNKVLVEYQQALHAYDNNFLLDNESDLDDVRSKCKHFDALVACKIITNCLFVKGDAVIGGDLLVEGNETINGDLTVNGTIFGLVTAATFPTDAGTAVPVAGEVNIFGGENIATTGVGNTVTINVAGTTDHAVQVGNAQGSLTSIPVGVTGEILVGVTGADPDFVPLTSTGGTIVITSGPNFLNIDTTGINVNTYQADAGVAMPALGILNILGGLNIRTTGAGNTITIHVDDTTNHAVQVGNSAGSLTSIPVGTNGQVLIGATGADPAFNDLTSPNGTIIFTPGPNSLGLDTAGAVATSFDTDAGTAIPVGGVLNVFGGLNIGTTGVGDTITINLDPSVSVTGSLSAGTTVAAGTTITAGTGITSTTGNITASAGNLVATNGRVIVIPGTAAAPSVTFVGDTNTGLSAAVADTLVASTNGLARLSISPAGIVTIANLGLGVVQSSATGVLSSSDGADGQVLIGSSTAGVPPVWNTITPGTGITITNGSGTITIATSGSTANTFNANVGSATPVAGVLNIVGGNDISTTGTGNTITINVSGTTQNTLQIGDATGGIASLPVATNGQIPIGSTGASPVISTITAGAGVTVTNGPGTITIASTAATTGNFKVQAYATVNQLISGAGTQTIAFGTETFDPNNNFAANTYTAPVTGTYSVSVNLSATYSNDNDRTLELLRNGVPVTGYSSFTDRRTAENFVSLINLTAGDLLSVRLVNTGGNVVILANHTSIAIHYVSA